MVEPKTDHEIELLNAVKDGHIADVKKLLSLDQVKVNDRRYFDYYLIIMAIDSHRIEIAKLLIDKGFRVYKKSKASPERTVLHAAVESKHQGILTSLLAKGASPDILAFDEQNKTPFHLAIDINNIYTFCPLVMNNNLMPIIELFLSQFDAEVYDKYCLLHYAIEKHDVRVVRPLLAKGLSLNKKNEKGLTPFCAATDNNLEIMDCLLSHHTHFKRNDHDDIAPAYVAILHGDVKVIKKYVDSGLSVNIPLKWKTNTWSCLANWLSKPGNTLLHFAVKLVKVEIVKYLLSVGADITVKNENGSSPLHISFEIKEIGIWKEWKSFHDNNLIIDAILKAHTKFNSNPLNRHGLSHFHIACSRDDSQIVDHFLKLGVSINQPVKSQCHLYKKFSPLHFAAKFRCKKTIELLLKNGANIKQKDYRKMTALHVAAQESSLETVSLLLEYGAGADIMSIDSEGNTPLHWAFENRNYKIIDLLLSVPSLANSNPTNSKGVSHFHIACSRNNVNVVKSFIENGFSVDICVPTKSDEDDNDDWSSYSPLHFAVFHNRPKIVQVLLDSGANVEIKTSKGYTPLHIACLHTCEMFREFIENILSELGKRKKIIQNLNSLTDVEVVHEKYVQFSGKFPKYYKGYSDQIDWSNNRKDHIKIMNTLLNSRNNINCIDKIGNTPLFYAYSAATKIKSILKNNLHCSESLWNEIVESLSKELYVRRKLIVNNFLELGANLDKCYKNGSILHALISKNEEDEQSDEMLKLFLKKGADVDAKDDERRTPLHQAILVKNKSLMSILLDYGADVDGIDPKNNFIPLLIAASEWTPSNSYAEIIEILLDKGANPNARRSDGRTPLHVLALLPYLTLESVFSALIEAGANVDIRDSKGRTALHLSCKVENNDALEELLKCGADINVEDNKGRTVYCYLYEKHLEDLSEDEDGDMNVDNDVSNMMEVLQKHVIRMTVIGLPISEKALSSNSKFDDYESLDEDEIVELVEKCQSEVQVFRDTPIHGSCSLFDVMFKSENTLSHLVKIPTFRSIYTVNCKLRKNTYPQYGYLVRLKYRTGVERGQLLPKAKFLLDKLAGLHLPDTCSENICKYFDNAELKESIENLRAMLDLEAKKSDDGQLKSRKLRKRQKTN